MKPLPFIVVLLAAALWLTAAEPIPSPPSPASNTNGMLIVCDDGFEYTNNTAIYRGNVHVLDAEMTLNCELLTVYFQTNLGRIDLIVAETNVFITQKDSLAVADRAVYTATNELVVLTGDVILDAPQGYLVGPKVTYDRKTGAMRGHGRILMEGRMLGTNSLAIPLPSAVPPSK